MTTAPLWRTSRDGRSVYEQRGTEPDTRPFPHGDPLVAVFLTPADATRAVNRVNTPDTTEEPL